ncbi:hypothetical protein JCM5296_007016 [Sporobolomyces johnsonii]
MSRQPHDTERDPAAPSRRSSRSSSRPPRDAQPPPPPTAEPSSSTASSSRGIGLGRPSRGLPAVATRRSSRRASLDPYPQQPRQQSPEAARAGGRSRRASLATGAVESGRDDGTGLDEGRLSEGDEGEEAERGSVAMEQGNGKCFELVVLQQPEIGAEAGIGMVTLGRLPIVPAPVVQVILQDQAGDQSDVELPYLFCSCSLREEDGAAPVEIAHPPESDDETGEEFSALIGNLVRNPHRVQDLDGNPASVFVFEDVSVRTKGKYRLEFRLGEARRPKSPKLAAVVSEPFDVVDWKDYPGRPAADTVTELSMHLHNQGVPMYIPPLVLHQPSDNPPPAGSNPFTVEQIASLSQSQDVAGPSSSPYPEGSPTSSP